MDSKFLLLGFWFCFLWPIAHLLNHNFEEFEKAGFSAVVQIASIAAIAVAAGTVLILVVARIAPQFKSATITIASLLALAFIFFADIHGVFAEGITWLGLTTGAGVALLAAMGMLISLVILLRRHPLIHRIVAAFAIVAGATPAAEALYKVTSAADGQTAMVSNAASARTSASKQSAESSAAVDKFSGENVYYVILDGYVGDRNLKKVIGLGIQEFLTRMKANGFAYLSESRSNYVGSATSIGSLFHLGYFRDENSTKDTLPPQNFFPIVMNRVPPPPLIDKLRQQDYSLLLSESWYSGCKDKYFECLLEPGLSSLNRESQLVLSRTPLKRLAPSLFNKHVDAFQPITEDVLKRHLRESTPFFLFAHHMQPHSPWYFDGNCNSIDTAGRAQKDLFRESVKCVNRTVTAFVKMVTKLDPTAIIVMHGDHGSGFTGSEKHQGVAEHKWSRAALDERSETLSLIRAPEACRNWLRSDLGPINTVRFVVACLAREKPNYARERLLIPGPTYAETHRLMEYTGFK
jgi:sulfatase-like protein